MMKLSSKALLFTFVTVSCSSVHARDHEMEVYANAKEVRYHHQRGGGLAGFIRISDGQSVQWSCKNGDCDRVEITFLINNPCRGGLVFGATATCDNVDASHWVSCDKAIIFNKCIPYTTTLIKNGRRLELIDDPEFIVDAGVLDTDPLRRRGWLVGLIGLVIGGVGGYVFRRFQVG